MSGCLSGDPKNHGGRHKTQGRRKGSIPKEKAGEGRGGTKRTSLVKKKKRAQWKTEHETSGGGA